MVFALGTNHRDQHLSPLLSRRRCRLHPDGTRPPRRLASSIQDDITPVPSEQAIANLKFGECPPSAIAGEVFTARLRTFVTSRCER